MDTTLFASSRKVGVKSSGSPRYTSSFTEPCSWSKGHPLACPFVRQIQFLLGSHPVICGDVFQYGVDWFVSCWWVSLIDSCWIVLVSLSKSSWRSIVYNLKLQLCRWSTIHIFNSTISTESWVYEYDGDHRNSCSFKLLTMLLHELLDRETKTYSTSINAIRIVHFTSYL